MNQYLFFVLLLAAAVSAQQIDPCTQSASWSNSSFSALINGMQAINYVDDRYAYLIQQTNTSNLGFSGAQALALSKQFPYVSNKNQMFKDLTVYWLGMTCSDVVAILKDLNYDSDKLDILPILVDIAYDLATQNQTIVDSFPYDSSKAEARQIIANAKPFSCIYGKIVAPRLIFVVDVSGSMSTAFTNPEDKKTYTRLQYVAQDLTEVIGEVLAAYQEFNVISFSSYANAWQPGIVPASSDNTKSALGYISKLRADGSTNMLAAMKLAFADPDAVAVYLMSDGQPDGGSATQSAIIGLAQLWANGATNGPRVVNTVSFQVGGTFDPQAAAFLNKLATSTGGVARTIN